MLDCVRRCPDGLLPVGAAAIVRISDATMPYLVVALTMILPGPTSVAKRHFAMAAALHVAAANADVIGELFCPGLGTGTGAVEPEFAADEMANAYGAYRRRMRGEASTPR